MGDQPKFTDESAERAVLAMIFYSRDFSPMSTEIKPADFADKRREAIWEAALSLEGQGTIIDAVTLVGALSASHPGMVSFEDMSAIADVLQQFRQDNVDSYIRRVISLSKRRALDAAAIDCLRLGEEDPDIAGAQFRNLSDAALTDRGGSIGVSPIDGIKGAIRKMVEYRKGTGGFKLGFPILDKTLGGGLGKIELMVLSGITGTGKTSFALQCADQVASSKDNPTRVLYFTGEMKADDLWERILSRRARVSVNTMQNGPTEADFRGMVNAADASAGSLLTVVDSGLEIEAIEGKVHRWVKEGGPGLVIIDTLDHVKCPGESDVSKIAAIMSRLKALNLRCEVPIILVVQFNRSVKDDSGRPTKFNLKGSSAIEAFSDRICLLYRPDPKHLGFVKLINDKGRRGPQGEDYDIEYKFTPHYTLFEEKGLSKDRAAYTR